MFNVSRPSGFKPFLGVSQEQARAAGPTPLIVNDCCEWEDDSGVVVTDAGVIEILSTIGGWGVWASEVIPALRTMDGEGKTILIRINSYGGDVFEGLAIANTIADLKARTVVEVIGVAASIASIIACAADVVRIRKSAQIMIHRPWSWTYGEAEELRAAADHLDLIETQLVDVYADRSNGKKSVQEFAAAVAKATWMSGTMAVEWGLADEIVSKAAVPATVDEETLDAAGIKNAPAELFASAEPEAAPVADGDAAPVEEAATDPTPVADATPVEEITPEAPAETGTENNSSPPATTSAGAGNLHTYDDLSEATIRAAFARAKAPAKADEAMAAGLTVEQAKAQAFDMLAAADTAAHVSNAIVGNEGTTAPKAKTPDEVMAEIRAQQVAAFAPKKR
jgi:ATP-dependent protease ClpP protease subunit